MTKIGNCVGLYCDIMHDSTLSVWVLNHYLYKTKKNSVAVEEGYTFLAAPLQFGSSVFEREQWVCQSHRILFQNISDFETGTPALIKGIKTLIWYTQTQFQL